MIYDRREQRNYSASNVQNKFDSGTKPPQKSLPYSDAELAADIKRLRCAWRDYRKSRHRSAIYEVLQVVYDLIQLWGLNAMSRVRTKRALWAVRRDHAAEIEPYRDLIAVAAHPANIDQRTLAKWSRALRYAAYKRPTKSLDRFMIPLGGINRAALLYTRRLGRKSKRAKKK